MFHTEVDIRHRVIVAWDRLDLILANAVKYDMPNIYVDFYFVYTYSIVRGVI